MNTNKFLVYLLTMTLLASCTFTSGDMQIIQTEQRSITTMGNGELKVSADTAQIIFNVRTTDKNSLAAKEKVQGITSNTLTVLKHNLKIKETDIETDYINVYPDSRTYQDYIAQTVIRVTTRDLKEIESIVTNVLKTGVTAVQIYFQVSNLDFYKEEARLLALQDAKLKAATMADELGQKLGDPISIQEMTFPPNYPNGFKSLSAFTNFEYLDFSTSTNLVAFGQITITSNVTIKFGLQ